MSNEAIWKTTTAVVLQSSGASIASITSAPAPVSAGTLTQSAAASYPLADLVLQCSMSGTIAANSRVDVYKRLLAVSSTTSEDAPAAIYPEHLVGNFLLPNSSGVLHTMVLENVPLGAIGDTEFFIDPQANANTNAGWTLKATPKTLGPAA